MEKETNAVSMPHGLMMQERHRLEATGVTEVKGFDDRSVRVITTQGILDIAGSDLHIDHIDLESGRLTVEGTVQSLHYSAPPKGGFFARLLR